MDSLIHTPPQEKAAGIRMAETGCRVNLGLIASRSGYPSQQPARQLSNAPLWKSGTSRSAPVPVA
ncbi:hypothetical protein [Mesorhizobium sp.]|uniref:hypothetical protein n=1 Tax=Mesorhizobium sp. TaxID=1871066 RepID=UPI000FE77DE7|nr:hypothetical protein [Mesorhizobium sp.]RWC45558.1 MAG: hypothetical protein EOS28_06325 [Mesorhizobium sp.]RWE96511.1 MAG: hypothetical protein EOS68_17410 [Mesorhizobium sp.]